MIETKELLFGIDSRLNKVSSLQNQAIPIPSKIIALNDAIIKVLNNKVNINNVFQSGFEASLQRISDLQNLVVREEKQVPVEHEGAYKTYRVDTTKFTHEMYMPVAIVSHAKRGKCKLRKINSPRLNKHSDIPLLMSDDNYCPSFRFQETLATYQDCFIDVYVDDPEGQFEIEEIFVTYLRYPKKVDIEGYKHFNGDSSTNVDCELPYKLKDDIITIAVTELAYSTGNMELIQPNILSNEKYQ